jgi:protein SCO1
MKTIMTITLLTSMLLLSACRDLSKSTPEKRTLPVLGEKIYDQMKGDTVFYSVKGFQLTDSDGKESTDSDFSGAGLHLISFFFTRCPSVCPALNRNLKIVSEHFKNDSSLTIHSVSIDPEYDTKDELAAYKLKTDIHNANWKFYTGERNTIFELARNCKLKAFDTNSEYTGLVHEPHVVLLDGQKRIRGYYNSLDEQNIQELIADIIHLKTAEAY